MAIKIYVDQGHNPVNPNAGAEGNGYREQDITYRIGKELERLLSADANFSVKVSRPTKETQLGTSAASSLAARVNEANAWGADLFLSLHTNASEVTSATGSEALVYSVPSRASRAATAILTALKASTGMRDRGVIARPGLYVLRKTVMPAVLLEMGFITSASDASLMVNEPERFARGIANGIRSYYGK